jgi:purine-nucleoside/S-methyl-5'-thioadenosine phosphorylase / adenosine deaminase
MPFTDTAGIRYYSFDIFPTALLQAIFTRRGGTSPTPWETLNVGGTVGDDAQRVRENRARLFNAVGRNLQSAFDVWQVHSVNAVPADAPRPPDEPHQKADIILTDKPNVTLFMRFADCVPILLFDPRNGVVCMAHAGWLGTVRGASSKAVKAMMHSYGSKAADILAAIGPSIGPDHYEVGPDVVEQIRQAFGADSRRLVETRGHGTYLDLWLANRMQLERAGVRQIETAAICTACHLEDWYSHRAEKGKTGRFGALIALPS